MAEEVTEPVETDADAPQDPLDGITAAGMDKEDAAEAPPAPPTEPKGEDDAAANPDPDATDPKDADAGESAPADAPKPAAVAAEAPASPASDDVPKAVAADAPDYDAYQKAHATLGTLGQQQKAIDDEMAAIDAKVEKNEIDGLDVTNAYTRLVAKQSRIDRQIRATSAELQQHIQNIQRHEQTQAETFWQTKGEEHKAIAETPQAATKLLKDWWTEEVGKVQKQHPKASEDFVRGVTMERWDRRIETAKATAAQPKAPVTLAKAPPPKDAGRVLPRGTSTTKPPAPPKDLDAEFDAQYAGSVRDML